MGLSSCAGSATGLKAVVEGDQITTPIDGSAGFPLADNNGLGCWLDLGVGCADDASNESSVAFWSQAAPFEPATSACRLLRPFDAPRGVQRVEFTRSRSASLLELPKPSTTSRNPRVSASVLNWREGGLLE